MSQTITRNDNNISLYVFDDDKQITVEADRIVIGDPEELIIADCNSGNTTVHTGVTAPDDWAGWKYFFDGTDWTLNPDWVDPATLA
jgi:hypothetical protein